MLDNSFGKAFPPAMVYSGFAILVIGIVIAFNNIIGGICMLVVGILLVFTKSGMQINPTDQLYRTYTNLLGIRIGKWESFSNYPDIAVLKEQVSTQARSQSNRAAITSSKTYYNIYLLTKNHREKLKIKQLEVVEQAKIDAKELAETLNKELKNYRPVVSQKSQARRRV